MEGNSKSLKSFHCLIHPEEVIQRVSKDSSAKQMLYCIECLMECDKVSKTNLVDMKVIVDQLYDGFSKIKPVKINSQPPGSLSDVHSHSEEYCYKMIQHINKQKEQVCSSIKQIQDDFNGKLEKTRETILLGLDMQIALFKKNIEEFGNKLGKFFKSESEEETEQTIKKEDLIADINNCRSSIDLETKIKSLLINLKESSANINEPDIEYIMIENVKSHKNAILKSLENLPLCYVTSEELIRFEQEKFNQSLSDLTAAMEKMKNRIVAFKFSLFSSEILAPENFEFIFSKIKNDTKFKTTLLTKTSNKASDFNLVNLEKMWVKNSHVLLAVRKEKEVYAVYRDGNLSAWNGGGNMLGPQQLMINNGQSCVRTITFDIAKNYHYDNPNQYMNYTGGGYINASNYLQLNQKEVYFNDGHTKKLKTREIQTQTVEIEIEIHQLDFEGKKEYPILDL